MGRGVLESAARYVDAWGKSMMLGTGKRMLQVGTGMLAVLLGMSSAKAQEKAIRDPAEGPRAKAQAKVPAKPAGAVARQSIDEKSMRALVHDLVSCGTRLTLSSWTDPKRGVGCGRDFAVARLDEIAKESAGKLQIVVDKFEMQNERTGDKQVHLENVYAILPGTDPALAKTVFIVVGDVDSRPSDVMDPKADAPGADDDASGVAVKGECARELVKAGEKYGEGSFLRDLGR